MKNSILIIAITALSVFNINAFNNAPYLISNENDVIHKHEIIKIFEWKVETNKNVYTGTSLSLEKAQQMITLTSKGEVIKGSEITSFFALKRDLESNAERNYFWEVETKTGRARGCSSSLEYARQMIKLVASGDAIVSNMIFSQAQQ